MNEPSKMPFEPIPVAPGTMPEPARPSTSRTLPGSYQPPRTSQADGHFGGERLPTGIAPEVQLSPAVPSSEESAQPTARNPLVRLVHALVRPTRSKAAVFAGLASLAVGAFGLSLLIPISAPSTPNTPTTPKETAALTPPPLRSAPTPTPAPAAGAHQNLPGDDRLPAPVLVPIPGSASLPPVEIPARIPALPVPAPLPASAAPVAPISLAGLNEPISPSTPPAALPVPLPPPGASAPVPLPTTPEFRPSTPAAPLNPTTPAPLPPAALPPVSVAPVALPPAPSAGSLPPALVPGTPSSNLELPAIAPPALPMVPGTSTAGAVPIVPSTRSATPPTVPALDVPSLPRAEVDVKPVPPPAARNDGRIILAEPVGAGIVEPGRLPAANVATAPVPGTPPALPGGSLPPAAAPAITPPTLPPAAPPVSQPPVPAAAAPAAAAAVVEPRTDFDVDIHAVKPGDTYTSVSKKYYDSAQYAEALRAFNRGAPIDATRQIEVPPLFVIRKTMDRQRGASAAAPDAIQPVGRVQTGGDSVEWGAVGARPRGEVRLERYIVPREGMTFKDIAFELYGAERDWGKIDNKQNYRYRPDERLAKGTELIVPIEDVHWQEEGRR